MELLTVGFLDHWQKVFLTTCFRFDSLIFVFPCIGFVLFLMGPWLSVFELLLWPQHCVAELKWKCISLCVTVISGLMAVFLCNVNKCPSHHSSTRGWSMLMHSHTCISCTHANSRAHIHTYTCAHMHTHAHLHMCTHTHTLNVNSMKQKQIGSNNVKSILSQRFELMYLFERYILDWCTGTICVRVELMYSMFRCA